MAGTSAQQLDLTLLPEGLQLIAEHCGEAVMWAVWKAYGGGHLSIPSKVSAKHPLAQALGLPHAQRLCEQFARETLQIPKWDAVEKAQRAARNQAIRRQRQQGVGLFSLAREYNLTERQVINIINKGGEAVPQVDLFDSI